MVLEIHGLVNSVVGRTIPIMGVAVQLVAMDVFDSKFSIHFRTPHIASGQRFHFYYSGICFMQLR